jgi:hypothetical protein
MTLCACCGAAQHNLLLQNQREISSGFVEKLLELDCPSMGRLLKEPDGDH